MSERAQLERRAMGRNGCAEQQVDRYFAEHYGLDQSDYELSLSAHYAPDGRLITFEPFRVYVDFGDTPIAGIYPPDGFEFDFSSCQMRSAGYGAHSPTQHPDPNFVPPGAPRVEDLFRWVEYVPGEQVQYGMEESDERSFWISCLNGKLEAGGPAGAYALGGPAIEVTLGGPAESKVYKAELIGRGDGTSFSTRIDAQDPIIRALMADQTIGIAFDEYHWEVPGEGAGAVVGPLIQSCLPVE
jgi:hypothetical protein